MATGYEETNGFFTPDGLFVPQQYVYQQYNEPAVQQFPQQSVTDVEVLKNLIRKQVYVLFQISLFHLLLTLNIFLTFLSCFYVDFEHVNVSWVVNFIRDREFYFGC